MRLYGVVGVVYSGVVPAESGGIFDLTSRYLCVERTGYGDVSEWVDLFWCLSVPFGVFL